MDEDIVRVCKKLQRYMGTRFNPIQLYLKFLLYRNFIFVLFRICIYLYISFKYGDIPNTEVLSVHLNTDIVNMNPVGGDNPGGGTNVPGSNQSGGSNPGGGSGWRPFHYSSNVREDGNSYTSGASPSLVLQTYDPKGNIPVQNDRQLGVLIDYRFNNGVKSLSYDQWNIANTLPSDSMVDKIAREKLLAHIFDHRSVLPTAYRQLNFIDGTPKWNSVKVTSYLINSLNNSSN